RRGGRAWFSTATISRYSLASRDCILKLYSRRHRLLLLLLAITFAITMPNEPFERSQGGIGAAAHGDDDLLVRTVGGVAGGEHAGYGGFAARAGDDFAHGVEFER